MTVSLPPEMVKKVNLVRKAEHRTTSELVREALRKYFTLRFKEEKITAQELRTIERGRREYKRGNYVTLEQALYELETLPRKVRTKKA